MLESIDRLTDAMFRLTVVLALLLVPPALAAPPVPPHALPPEVREALLLRFQHREARIREALARGDLTIEEAQMLRQRLARRRARLEQGFPPAGHFLPPPPPNARPGPPPDGSLLPDPRE